MIEARMAPDRRKREPDVAGLVALGLFLLGLALTLAPTNLDGWGSEIPFAGGFVCVACAWLLHRREAAFAAEAG